MFVIVNKMIFAVTLLRPLNIFQVELVNKLIQVVLLLYQFDISELKSALLKQY